MSAKPSLQWPAKPSSQAFHPVEPFKATTVSRIGSDRLGRPEFPRFGSTIGFTTELCENGSAARQPLMTIPGRLYQ